MVQLLMNEPFRKIHAPECWGIILKKILGKDNVNERHLARKGWKRSTCSGLCSECCACLPAYDVAMIQNASAYTEEVPEVSLMRQ